MATESFFSNASLAYLASAGAGKDGKTYSIKPTDGTGDFTFSRGSNLAATRVGADGLIEKGRENLLTYSNQFDTTWGATNLLRTANTIANPLDGLVNSYTLSLNSGTSQKYISKNISQIGIYTQSVYLKAGTHQFVQLLIGDDTAAYANFDLVNGLKFFSGSGCIDANIEPIGADGWYRCSMKYKSTKGISLYVWAVDSLASARGSSTSSSGDLYVFGFQLEVGLTSTEYIESGATTGKAGLLEDEPRFDYSGGATCPSLLLEPSRTNLVKYSEYFGDSYWTKSGTSVVSGFTSPEGLSNAYKLVEDSSNSVHFINSSGIVTPDTTYSSSVYIKPNGRNKVALRENSITGNYASFDLSDGTLIETTGVSASIESVSNGWYRVDYQVTSGPSYIVGIYLLSDSYTSGDPYSNPNPYQGDGTSGVYIYGAQMESGSYPTSYIPNHSGGSVTRGAVDFFASGLSAVAGQTEGTILLDYEKTNSDNVSLGGFFRMTLSDNSNNNIIYFGFQSNENNVTIVSEGVLGVSITNNNSGQTETRVKIAIAYAENDFEMYYNGTQVGVDTSGAVPINMSRIDFGVNRVTTTKTSGKINQMLLFDTRLSSADLATLTTL